MTKLDVQYRVATPQDIDAVLRLNAALYEYEGQLGFYEDSFDLGWTYSDAGRAYFAGRLDSEQPGGVVFVATLGSQCVGYLAAGLGSPRYRSVTIAEIENMYVDTDVRRSGIGRQLVKMFRQWATDNNAGRVRVAAFSGNEALTFYKSTGFNDFETLLEANV